MDARPVRGPQLSPEKAFDQKVDLRAEKREYLRGRNNVTSCRSPTRELNTRLIKNELKEKRHLEFLRRRSVSPEPCGENMSNYSSRRKLSPNTFSLKHYSSFSKSEKLYTNIQNTPTANGRLPTMILTPNSKISDGPSTSNWAALWSEQVTLRQEKGSTRSPASTSPPEIKETTQSRTKGTDKREIINGQNTNIKTFIQTEKIHKKFIIKTENILQKKIMHESSVQTLSGFVTVKESDLQRLTDYLQEALWREEAVRKKLAALQESTSNLVNSSSKIWTARCSEDLLRNKIKALEAQLQVSLQKFPKDGVKRLVIQMEKQKMVYEERALVTLQKVTQEKTEALCKAETLQEALVKVSAESLRWQSLYEELKLNSGQLQENQHLSDDQLQQLQSQAELSRGRESGLRQEVVSLRQGNKDLQYNASLLEEDNQTLREEIQDLRDVSNKSQDLLMQERVMSEEAETRLAERRDSEVKEELRHTQEKLQLKERECEELQTELHAVEQECKSSQARLSQCRDELRQLSHHRRRPTRCGSCWKVCLFLLFLLAVAGVAMLWLWHPPFREQVEDLYSDIETRIEDYLMDMASPQHSGCFRPI
ncbi:TRAF3-interacting JNK-activating modulator [Trematomus bernacchii]|uniref:TRAF3-interacting JNK-activating modulator n=1 Tax=Trematomus bernacchii TaxID=40690 RepID=UPI00146E097F|nr:TRAF3-interacting JNK-activating modulator [Trematomus bernacchii]